MGVIKLTEIHRLSVVGCCTVKVLTSNGVFFLSLSSMPSKIVMKPGFGSNIVWTNRFWLDSLDLRAKVPQVLWSSRDSKIYRLLLDILLLFRFKIIVCFYFYFCTFGVYVSWYIPWGIRDYFVFSHELLYVVITL